MKLIPYELQYLDRVCELAREMHSESLGHRNLAFSETKFRTQLRLLERLPSYFCRLSQDSQGVICGGFIGCVTTTFFSEELVARDLVWFVTRARRKGPAALMLLRAFEAWALEQKAKQLWLGQSTGVEVEATQQLYKALGYNIMGATALKEI